MGRGEAAKGMGVSLVGEECQGGTGGTQVWTELAMGLWSSNIGISVLMNGGQGAWAGLQPWRGLVRERQDAVVAPPEPVPMSFLPPGMPFPG